MSGITVALGILMFFCGFVFGFTVAALLSMSKQADSDNDER